MTPERFAKVKAVFLDAIERPADERAGVILERCGGDGELAAHVHALLANHTRDDEFLRPTSRGESSMLVGRRVGAFTIVRTIASGGMGTVFEATQHHPQRSVALKILRAALASRASVRRFEEESAILARLRHPGIAQVYEAGVHQEGGVRIPYFAMELIERAETITVHADRMRMSVRERVELFIRVCDAVHHGHQNAVIHRDLKPANILVGSDGMPKVIDFGVARVTDQDPPSNTQRTDAGQLVGTLSYMSPEQAMSTRGTDVDTRSDVYTLGLVLYELLCGRRAYEIAELPLAEATSVIRERVPTRPGALRRELKGDLETIVLRALEKDRERRYQSAAELAEDLRRFVRHEPILARPATLVYQATLFARRHRSLVVAACVVVLTLLAGTCVSVWFAMRERDQSIRANLATLEATREAQRVRRIREFLQGALGSANPFLPKDVSPELLQSDYEPWADYRQSNWGYSGRVGEAASVKDVLKAAAARVTVDFDDDPAGEAEVLDVLGWTLHVLGESEEAKRLLERAYTLRVIDRGTDVGARLRTTLHLAEVHLRTWNGERAELLYREAATEAMRAYGNADARTLRVHRMLAETMAVVLHRTREACDELERVVETLRVAGQHDEPAAIETRAYAARLWCIAGEQARAEQMIEQAEEALRSKRGDDDVRWGDLYESMALVYQRNPNRIDEALAAGRQAVRSRARWFGEQSLRTGYAYKMLADVHRVRGDVRSCLEAESAAEVLFRNLVGADQWEAMRTKAACGELLVRLGERLDEADRMLREAASGMDKLYGRPSAYGAEYKADAARAQWAQGRRAEAIELLSTSAAALREFAEQGLSSPSSWATAMRDLSVWLVREGRRDEARVAISETLRWERGPIEHEHALRAMLRDLEQTEGSEEEGQDRTR